MEDLLLLAARKITKGRVSDDDKARTYLNECEKMLNQLCGRENTNSETTPGDGRQPLPRPQCLTPKWSAFEHRTDHSIPTGDVNMNLCRPDDDVGESDSSASLDGHDKLYSMVQFFGLPSWFVTVSPDDTNSRIVMTISHQCAWVSQAASKDDQVHKVRPPVEWTVCASYPERARRIAENPVAAAKFFSSLTEAMMAHLCELQCAHLTRKTRPHTSRSVGVLGKTLAHFAALECQGRGSLHFHAVMWSGLTPELLQALATDDPELEHLRTVTAQALDSMVRAKLSPEAHADRADDIEHRHELLNTDGPASLQSTYPEAYAHVVDQVTGSEIGDGGTVELAEEQRISAEQLLDFAERRVVNVVNFHTHSKTCHKGKHGSEHCRMANPHPICGAMEGRTGPVELQVEVGLDDEDGEPGDSSGAWQAITANPVSSRPPPHLNSTEEDYLRAPFKPIDPRATLWEVGREGANGDGMDECVVPFSVAFSMAGGCNTAVMPLGCSEQAKAVCFYLLKYITKDSTALENTRVVVRRQVPCPRARRPAAVPGSSRTTY